MRHHDPSKCELESRWEKRRIPQCAGAVKKVGTVSLCLRHRRIVTAILEDAIRLGTVGVQSRHPRYISRKSAA